MPAWRCTSGLCGGRLSLAVLALTEALTLVGKLNFCGREIIMKQHSPGKLNLHFSLVSFLFCIQEEIFFQRIDMRSLSVKKLEYRAPQDTY